jgi:creatinine amidohydrolase/Fe(II)-dependent formamide hydrolase-like protein/7-cyano-7-deazaguanine synthase in queuosine biosynthesis
MPRTTKTRAGAAEDALQQFVVFDRLEVGPARLEPRRMVSTYRTWKGDKSEEIELSYSYEEDVFDAKESADHNLANMIAAQVAINYGLFCRKIEFHGQFDVTDRRFIRAAMENTAREIYIKKLLEPNAFLRPETVLLKAEKRRKYVAAQIEFSESAGHRDLPPWSYRDTDRSKHAILSSGGKDSLLSYALLNEAGFETHPVYINESGRHWLTALNAYRHFEKNVPNTARVWVNSDRVFPWMLRQMPFIRSDFARVRSDQYPIRLWTVAVFLFGALPIMRKRGVGRLVIGDEYDSTERRKHEGITHYNGYYDQSRYFDAMLSRYFMHKGWAVSQFSLLRQASEFLIQKTLVERYPELQKHQVSCHAAHTEDDRVHPCGKCEKCRRIVGMLLALGADPKRCGYSEKQIAACLASLEQKGVSLEEGGVDHLAYLLAQANLVEWSEEKRATLRPRPEVMQLRFDPVRSPIVTVPVNLRRPILQLLLEHSDGAVQRSGRSWKPFNVMSFQGLRDPFPFETEAALKRPRRGKASKRESYLWAEMTWPEIERRLKKVDIALLPVGSIEQHGPHLTVDIDAFDADYLTRRVAAACSQPRPFVLPAIPYGVSYQHREFKGTLSIDNSTLAQLVYDVGMSAAENGIKKLVIINGHGDNAPTLAYAAQMINRDSRIFVCVDTGETSDVDVDALASTANDVHAGEIETSTSLAVRPHLVQMDKAARHIPEFSSRYLNFSSQRGLPWYAHTKLVSTSGVIGDPTKATAQKGAEMWQVMILHLVTLVEDLKGLTLDEIFQRRY